MQSILELFVESDKITLDLILDKSVKIKRILLLMEVSFKLILIDSKIEVMQRCIYFQVFEFKSEGCADPSAILITWVDCRAQSILRFTIYKHVEWQMFLKINFAAIYENHVQIFTFDCIHIRHKFYLLCISVQ